MATVLAYEAACSTYEDSEEVIRSVVRRFVRKYGGDRDEVLGRANVLFMEAHEKYVPSRGRFLPWLRFMLWRCLHDELRKTLYRKNILNPVGSEGLELFPDKRSTFDVSALLDELSADAACVVNLTLDQASGPASKHQVIIPFLREAGWTIDRIMESFDEIRRAL